MAASWAKAGEAKASEGQAPEGLAGKFVHGKGLWRAPRMAMAICSLIAVAAAAGSLLLIQSPGVEQLKAGRFDASQSGVASRAINASEAVELTASGARSFSEATRFSALSYKGEADKPLAGQVATGRVVEEFHPESKGYFENGVSAMRVFETTDTRGRSLVISFSGSDDLNDFVRDANTFNQGWLRSALKGLGNQAEAHSRLMDMGQGALASAGLAKPPPAEREIGWLEQTLRSAEQGPARSIEELDAGMREAIEVVKAVGGRYDRVVVAGHSLGGALANDFSIKLGQELHNEGRRDILAKTEMITVNTLYLTAPESQALAKVQHFRERQELTDIIGKLSGLRAPDPSRVVYVGGDPIADAAMAKLLEAANSGSKVAAAWKVGSAGLTYMKERGLQIVERHMDSNAERRSDAALERIPYEQRANGASAMSVSLEGRAALTGIAADMASEASRDGFGFGGSEGLSARLSDRRRTTESSIEQEPAVKPRAAI